MTFTDKSGREWRLALDFAKLRAIRDKTGLDLGDLECFGECWARIMYSDELALAAVWIAMGDQVAAINADAKLTYNDWLASMDGDTLEKAREALLAARVNFTTPRKRGMIEASAGVLMKHYQQAIAEAEKTIHSLTTETAKTALERLGNSLPSAPASSASSMTAGQ